MEEGIKIKIGEIRKALAYNKELTKGYEEKERNWESNGVYDSSLKDFARTFLQSLPNWVDLVDEQQKDAEHAFRDYVEETLSGKEKHDLTAAEFGGSGSELFKGFTADFFRRTVGVCLKDIRNGEQKAMDRKNNHFVIEGDITKPLSNEILIKVVKTLGANKVDLIISRMVGPLKYIDKHGAILDRLIRNWYDMLNENGLIFIQFEYYKPLPGHNPTTIMIEKWSSAIKERYPEIDVQVEGDTLRLHKKTGAPEKLPPATQLFK